MSKASGWKGKALAVAKFLEKWMNKASRTIENFLNKEVEVQKRNFFLEYDNEMTEEEIKELRYRLAMKYLIPGTIILIVLIFVGRALFES